MTVALGFEELGLSEEVLHFLEHDPAFRVVGTATDRPGLTRLVREAHPATVVGSPALLAGADGDGAVRLAVSERESIGALRDAIRAGAAGFYRWPEERQSLTSDALRLVRRSEEERFDRGTVVAVYGARGGAGTTFLATHLAAACAGSGARTCLADCDPGYADVAAALGVPPNGPARTISDLVPVFDELTVQHVDDVLYEHPRGFRVLLGPADPTEADAIEPAHVAAAIGVLAGHHDVLVLDVPRSMDDVARSALGAADHVLLVVTLDVLAFRDAKRAMAFLASLGVDGRVRLIVNRAARSEVIPEDCERVFGLPPSAVLPEDRAVPTAQNRGELLSGRRHLLTRRLDRLARELVGARVGARASGDGAGA